LQLKQSTTRPFGIGRRILPPGEHRYCTSVCDPNSGTITRNSSYDLPKVHQGCRTGSRKPVRWQIKKAFSNHGQSCRWWGRHLHRVAHDRIPSAV